MLLFSYLIIMLNNNTNNLVKFFMQFKSPSVVLFIGPPMSGKGTQSQLLSENLGMYHISSGDVLHLWRFKTPIFL